MAEENGAGTAPSNVVDISAARKEGSDAAIKTAAEIAELCSLAGKPELSAGFIAAGKSVAEVRKELLAAKANGAGAEIHSQHAAAAVQTNGGGPALIAECKRLAETAARHSA